MIKVDTSCILIIGIITNNLKFSSQTNFTPLQRPFIITQNICRTYFVLRARSEVGDTLFGTMSKGFIIPFKDFPVKKTKNQILLIRNPEETKLQKHSTSVQLHYFCVCHKDR